MPVRDTYECDVLVIGSGASGMSAAVTEALRERLERVKSKGSAERIRKIRGEFAAQLKGRPLPDHAELLYDEKGLPK